jgi:hypothetical protein
MAKFLFKKFGKDFQESVAEHQSESDSGESSHMVDQSSSQTSQTSKSSKSQISQSQTSQTSQTSANLRKTLARSAKSVEEF